MKLWQEIISTAIVGTERHKFGSAVQPGDDLLLHRVLQSLQSDNPETALLKSAAVIGAYLKNGVNAAPDREPLPEPAANENSALISSRSEHHLATMLAGNYPQLLPEFFNLAAEKERILPPQFLPEVLDLGNSRRDLRQYILPVLGERGRWLARHNSDWRWALIEENAAEIWENGSRDERLFAIESIRRKNPAEARELLMREWQSESAKGRAAFLEVLRINPGKSDEEFLEKTLQTDKSADVRRLAFDLLREITGSNLAEILNRRALALLSFKPGGVLSKPEIEINFPENFEKEEKGDVLNDFELFFNERDLGKKAFKIVKLLHFIPPKIWEEKFSAKREVIIEAAKRSDWEKALFSGLKSAAVNFADHEWLISILTQNGQNDYYLLCNQIERRWTSLQIEQLIGLLLLDGKMKSGIGSDFAVQLLYRLKTIWSEDFTLKILKFLQRAAVEKDLKSSSGFLNHLLNSGQFVSAKYLDRFEEKNFSRLFETISEQPGKAKLTEEFIAVIGFRREIRAVFQNEE